MKRVLAIQNCWDDPPGYLGEILQEQGGVKPTRAYRKEVSLLAPSK
jgi:hypothetical protein